MTVKNVGPTPTTVYSAGSVMGPVLAVPEPSTWAMLVLGFGAIGMASRRRPPPDHFLFLKSTLLDCNTEGRRAAAPSFHLTPALMLARGGGHMDRL